jgi:hypothetical protein
LEEQGIGKPESCHCEDTAHVFEAGVREVGRAYRGITQPGGAHSTGGR